MRNKLSKQEKISPADFLFFLHKISGILLSHVCFTFRNSGVALPNFGFQAYKKGKATPISLANDFFV